MTSDTRTDMGIFLELRFFPCLFQNFTVNLREIDNRLLGLDRVIDFTRVYGSQNRPDKGEEIDCFLGSSKFGPAYP